MTALKSFLAFYNGQTQAEGYIFAVFDQIAKFCQDSNNSFVDDY